MFPFLSLAAIECNDESSNRTLSLEFSYMPTSTEVVIREFYSNIEKGTLLGKLQFSASNGELRVKLNEFIGGESTIARTDLDDNIYVTHNYLYLDMENSNEGEVIIEDSKLGNVLNLRLINCRANSSTN